MANLVAAEAASGCATHGSEEATVTLLRAARAARCVIAWPLLTRSRAVSEKGAM
jgi:hypothetical protein